MENRQKIIEKLVKIKALAERGIGGEQQTAQVMYATLKEKYKVTDAEIEKAAAVPVDISEIDLKKFWGIAFQLAAVAKTLQEESKMGRDINPSYLTAKLMEAGVKRVEVRKPVFTVVDDIKVAKLGSKSVLNGGIENV